MKVINQLAHISSFSKYKESLVFLFIFSLVISQLGLNTVFSQGQGHDSEPREEDSYVGGWQSDVEYSGNERTTTYQEAGGYSYTVTETIAENEDNNPSNPSNPTGPPPIFWADLTVDDLYFIEVDTGIRVSDDDLKTGVYYIPVAEYRNLGPDATWRGGEGSESSAIAGGAGGADGSFPTVVRIDTTGETQSAATNQSMGTFKNSYNGVPMRQSPSRNERVSYVSVKQSTPLAPPANINPNCGDTPPEGISFNFLQNLSLSFTQGFSALRNNSDQNEPCKLFFVHEKINANQYISHGTYLQNFRGRTEPADPSVTYSDAEINRNTQNYYGGFLRSGIASIGNLLSFSNGNGENSSVYFESDELRFASGGPEAAQIIKRVNLDREKAANTAYLLGLADSTYSHAIRDEWYRREVINELEGRSAISSWWSNITHESSGGRVLTVEGLMYGINGALRNNSVSIYASVGDSFSSTDQRVLERFVAQDTTTVSYDPVIFTEPKIIYADAMVDPGGRMIDRWYGTNLPEQWKMTLGVNRIACGDKSGCVSEARDDRSSGQNHGVTNVIQKTFTVLQGNTIVAPLLADMRVTVGEAVQDIPFVVTNYSSSLVPDYRYNFFINGNQFVVDELTVTNIAANASHIDSAQVNWNAPNAPTTVPMRVCVRRVDASEQCSSAQIIVSGSAPQCSDGIDNDGDGNIDVDEDAGCFGPNDDNETNPVVVNPVGSNDPEITATPNIIRAGDEVIVDWNLNGNVGCTFSGSGSLSGIDPMDASYGGSVTINLNTTALLTITCAGGASDSTQVRVLPVIYET